MPEANLSGEPFFAYGTGDLAALMPCVGCGAATFRRRQGVAVHVDCEGEGPTARPPLRLARALRYLRSRPTSRLRPPRWSSTGRTGGTMPAATNRARAVGGRRGCGATGGLPGTRRALRASLPGVRGCQCERRACLLIQKHNQDHRHRIVKGTL